MAVVEFRQPDTAMINHIAGNMRKADVAEVWASHRFTPVDAIVHGVELSKLTTVVMINNTPCAILGLVVNSVITGSGTPWLLSTDDAMNHKRGFIDLVPLVIDEMLNECPILYNYVHNDNKVSIRWLKRIGFMLDNPEPYGVNNELFCKFHMRRIR